jgi:hypothetical protein
LSLYTARNEQTVAITDGRIPEFRGRGIGTGRIGASDPSAIERMAFKADMCDYTE